MEISQIAHLLNNTLNPDGNVVHKSTESLDRLSLSSPNFAFSLLSLATDGESRGLRIAAATYLKNFTRRNIDVNNPASRVSKEFKDGLVRALLKAELPVSKVLVEAFRVIVVAEFVNSNLWPELVPELRSVIQNSDLINNDANSDWKTINALVVLQALVRPFQYFLNPKVANEPVPPQLEILSSEILVPLQAAFHQLVEKALGNHDRMESDIERFLLVVCKCIYLSVRSHMPSALVPHLPLFCHDLFGILGSLSFESDTSEDGYLLRLKTGKRGLLIFCSLVTRHRKYSDKLMPNIIKCASAIVRHSSKISKLDFLSERVLSVAFDVISHVLETGPGWRLVSPHFSSLLDLAIFPALVMNEKDVLEWEDEPDEYIRKNLPSDLEEISGWREDLFTARKSALNLLGVISMSKGPRGATNNNSLASYKRKKGERKKINDGCRSMGELLVMPFLSKFPIPSDVNATQSKIVNDYYGVLMAYGGLQEGQRPEYIATLIRTRVLPLYMKLSCFSYLVATANWLLGELASCLPEEMSKDVYSSLLTALAYSDVGEVCCYPVRASAAGAIAGLLENEYYPPEWLPLLHAVIDRIGKDDDETSILFQLLSTVVEAGDENITIHIPSIISSLIDTISSYITPGQETWPQVVEQGFSALAVMAQSWEDTVPEDFEQDKSSEKWVTGRRTIARAFSDLLQKAWLVSMLPMENEDSVPLPSQSSMDDLSTLLCSIMRSVTERSMISELKLSELLVIWANVIAEWHAWEELEDLSIFDCIKEVVNLDTKFGLENFLFKRLPPPPAPPVPQRSIVEAIGAFVSNAISQYPSAMWKACSCVHLLLHLPKYSFETEDVKQALVIAFSRAAFSRFREEQKKPNPLWKPLLLVLSSCYLCYPDIVMRFLDKDEEKGFRLWLSALSFISTSSYEHGMLQEPEIKLIVMALLKVVEQQLETVNQDKGLLQQSITSFMEAFIRLREVQKEQEDEEEEDEDKNDNDGEGDNEEDEDDDDEDSEEEVHEETEEEFLDRYAKAAAALENGTIVEEGDVEDQEQELELGGLEEVDLEGTVQSLLERYQQVLVQGQALPQHLISSFLDTFPEYSVFFHQYR
ncbi:Importin-beta, N-terminal domain [Dillenia turbinata]|uniref:Importin-beta, N-terminal domain n=1 Tax=Dillenia turbinata TaxID=194707 RepID=A0AAN8VEQ4_9MAGN